MYEQKGEVRRHASELETAAPKSPALELDKETIEKIVLILTMECQSPSSGIQAFFEEICGIKVSAGRIARNTERSVETGASI